MADKIPSISQNDLTLNCHGIASEKNKTLWEIDTDGAGYVKTKDAQTGVIVVVPMPESANVYPVTFPVGTRYISINSRLVKTLKYAFDSAENIAIGNYKTIPAGIEYLKKEINLTAEKTYYFKSDENGENLEIEYWK